MTTTAATSTTCTPTRSAYSPSTPSATSTFEYYEDALLKDFDFQVLWSPDLDGIEDDELVVARLGYLNLQPSRWFLPFDAGSI